MNQLKVLASVIRVLVTTKLPLPAATLKAPKVAPVSCTKIRLEDEHLLVETVAEPLLKVPVPAVASEPVLMRRPVPTVERVKFPVKVVAVGLIVIRAERDCRVELEPPATPVCITTFPGVPEPVPTPPAMFIFAPALSAPNPRTPEIV